MRVSNDISTCDRRDSTGINFSLVRRRRARNARKNVGIFVETSVCRAYFSRDMIKRHDRGLKRVIIKRTGKSDV